ncbi:TPA: hypothetical protein ACGOVU_000973 [Streptococcus suis]
MSNYYFEIERKIKEYYKNNRKELGLTKWLAGMWIFLVVTMIEYFVILFDLQSNGKLVATMSTYLQINGKFINFCLFFFFIVFIVLTGFFARKYVKNNKSSVEIRKDLRKELKKISPRPDFETLLYNLLEEIKNEESKLEEQFKERSKAIGTFFSIIVISPVIYILSQTWFSEEEVRKFTLDDLGKLLSMCFILFVVSGILYYLFYELFITSPILGKKSKLMQVKYKIQDVLYFTTEADEAD